jgi:RNA binding exosome subunit
MIIFWKSWTSIFVEMRENNGIWIKIQKHIDFLAFFTRFARQNAFKNTRKLVLGAEPPLRARAV